MTRASAMPIGSVKIWRDLVGRRLLSLDFKPSSEEFWADVESIPVPLRTAVVSQSPGCSFRDNELVRDGDDAFSLAICRRGRIAVTHRGRETVLGPGDAVMLRTSDTGMLASAKPFTHCSVIFPAEELFRRAPDADQWVMHHIPAASERLRLLKTYVSSAGRRSQHDPAVRDMVRQHLFDAVMLLYKSGERDIEQVSNSLGAMRLHAACDIIAQRFHEPDLGVHVVAANLGISTRYLQRLFESTGRSFTQHINELRLLRAHELLRDSDGKRRVTDIALGVGFADISHFNRLFRRRFGDTPTSVCPRKSKPS